MDIKIGKFDTGNITVDLTFVVGNKSHERKATAPVLSTGAYDATAMIEVAVALARGLLIKIPTGCVQLVDAEETSTSTSKETATIVDVNSGLTTTASLVDQTIAPTSVETPLPTESVVKPDPAQPAVTPSEPASAENPDAVSSPETSEDPTPVTKPESK